MWAASASLSAHSTPRSHNHAPPDRRHPQGPAHHRHQDRDGARRQRHPRRFDRAGTQRAALRTRRRSADGRRRLRHPRPGAAARGRTLRGADCRLRGQQRRPRRRRRHSCRRQGIHPTAARPGADRSRARRRRRRRARARLSRRDDGACGQAGAADRAVRRLGPDHRRIRHRQGSAGALRARPLQSRPRVLHLDQLRGDPGEPAGVRVVRPREGRLHRRGGAPHRQVRGGDRRHALARRNLRDGSAPAGQAPARAAGTRHRPRRRHQAGAGRHPRHRYLEPQPGRSGARRHLPRGPLVSPQRRQLENSAACASGRPT